MDVGFSCSFPKAEPVKEEVQGLSSELGEQSVKKKVTAFTDSEIVHLAAKKDKGQM